MNMRVLVSLSCLVLYACGGALPEPPEVIRTVELALETEIFHSSDPLRLPSPADIREGIADCDTLLSILTPYPEDQLSETDRRAFQILESRLVERKNYLLDFRRDPARYNLGGIAARYLLARDLSEAEKVRYLQECLQYAPLFFDLAKRNLSAPLPEQTALGIRKQEKTLMFFYGELADSLEAFRLDASKAKELSRELMGAELAVKDYLAYCNSLMFEHRDTLPVANEKAKIKSKEAAGREKTDR
ncbi:MAG: hypothetical protein R3350_02210 [Saprospiraceae bacterium]|nr:hypothetical protein [Saprospiraceae bacterium]